MKYSRQRAAILSFLENCTEHPTAEMVYAHVVKEFPNISLGTVYRNLNQLAGAGQITRFQLSGQPMDRYDFDTSSHYHFVCGKCGCVEDIGMGDMSFLKEHVSDSFKGKISGHVLYFQGTCEKCMSDAN